MTKKIFKMTKVIYHFIEKKHWSSISLDEEKSIIKTETEETYSVDYEEIKRSFFDNIPEGFDQAWIDIDTEYENLEFVSYVEYRNGSYNNYDKEINVWFDVIVVNESLIKAINDLQSM